LVGVALERQDIEKKDFPIGRRGYDPEAVDAHLKAVADEVEKLRNSARRRSETLASTASDHVRAIVEAAEKSAAEIQRHAEEEAQETRTEASAEAQSQRDEAAAQAREHVSKVSEATASMLERLDAMDTELGALVESLRTGSGRLSADLSLLETNLGDVREAASPGGRFEPDRGAERERALGLQTAAKDELPAAAEAIEPVAAPGEATTVVDEIEEPLSEPAAGEASAAAGGNGADDTEGARLIALNMALNGTPRDETDRYLAANFDLVDRGGLLDDVYASVKG
jgi:DivIVA domain-containing protein